MNKKLYWGLGVLFGLIIGGFVFLIVQQKAELNEWEADAAKDKKLTTAEKPPLVENKPPPPVSGFKWVQHGDHYDKVPISDPNGTPIAQGAAPVKQTYTGPLTYHAELLETNPVKALRLQAEERGHWSAEWIPPFPPDDTEAQEFARSQYLSTYYWHTKKGWSPEYAKVAAVFMEMFKRISNYPWSARRFDLMKITWTPQEYILKHYTEDGDGFPSNFFLPYREPHPLANTPANKIDDYKE